MACFLVSTTVGIGAAVARHIVKHHENKLELEGKTQLPEKFGSDVKWSQKLAYLELTLFSAHLFWLLNTSYMEKLFHSHHSSPQQAILLMQRKC